MQLKPLILRADRDETVAFVARGIQAYNRSDLPAPAHKALRKPALITLMTHCAPVVAEHSRWATAAV